MRRPLALAGVFACLAAGLALCGEQGYLAAKAALAERLIERAFEAHLEDGERHAPWSWADTHPVARLEVPRLAVSQTVLSGATGASLAFGPGHIHGTALPNAQGNSGIAGHRESWFRFLGDVLPGDELWLETRDGRVPYRVVSRSIRSTWEAEAVLARKPGRMLTLVTCWPLDDLLPGSERLIVVAEAVSG